MYNISNELKAKLFLSNEITATAKLIFSDPQLVIDSTKLIALTLKDCCYNEGRIIGTNIAKDLEVQLYNDNYDLQDKEFSLEIGILLDDGTYEYIPYGNFIIDTVKDTKSNNIYKITAMDYMLKLNGEFVDNNTYPITLREFLTSFASQYGVNLASQALPNESFIIPTKPYFEKCTGRAVLSRMGEMFCRFAKFNRNSELEFFFKNITDTKISRKNMNSKLSKEKLYGEVNVVTLALGEGIEGENVTLRDEESIKIYGETSLIIEDNPFIYTDDLRQKAIGAIYKEIVGFKYYPTSFKYMGHPEFDCGDVVQVQDMETDTYFDTIILNNTIVIAALRQSTVENKALTNTQVKYPYIKEEDQRQSQTEARVNKAENNIFLLTSLQDETNEKIAKINVALESISSTIKLIGGNNLQSNSIGAYGTDDYEQSEEGKIVATEEELLKEKTDNGFGRIIYLSSNKWIKLKSENLTIGETYTVSFKYSNTSDNQCTIKLQNNEEITLVDTTSENDLTKVVYTFKAFTENVKIFVSTANGTVGFTDYYLQNGDTATKWQPANGEVLSTALSIYYNGIEVTSENSEIITKISNLGFSVVNKVGKVLITFNKEKCILSDTEVDGRLEQNGWLRYVQKIDNNEVLLEVKI